MRSNLYKFREIICFMRSGDIPIFLIFIVFAGYFINTTFSFIALPDLSLFEKWINFCGGILLIFGAFSFLSARRYSRRVIR